MGARVSKRYHAPETDCGRLLSSDAVPEATKERLRAIANHARPAPPARRDPECTAGARCSRGGRAASRGPAPRSRSESAPQRPCDRLARRRSATNPSIETEVAKALAHAQRRTQAVWPKLLGWLPQEPYRSASDSLLRSQTAHPGESPDTQLRTLQRRVKVWRRAASMKLVLTPDVRSGDGNSMMMI